MIDMTYRGLYLLGLLFNAACQDMAMILALCATDFQSSSTPLVRC